MEQKAQGWDLDPCPWVAAENVRGPVLFAGQKCQECLGL